MTRTRASIDRPLDLLSVQAKSARHHGGQRTGAALIIIETVGHFGMWWRETRT